ncbi:MAG: 1,4-dihydroxy-2-naphthoate octaprenyltransferase [Frankiales bacterium]|nr:1,4-dihydroxy-2-naphthoate octaprenyltransferase [Frankiales bacterium]
MAVLVRRVGLGLASSGDVRTAVSAAERARAAGLESVWFHESYFERDAVTYATATAAAVPDIAIGIGAVNVNTRHQIVLAMTVSALDDLAPGRIRLGLGTALPLRLHQMGIPYDPDAAIARIETAMADLKKLWAGERLPGGAGAPEIEPMFPPVHRTPLWVAGYRRAFHELAGRAADGYLARPAESVQGIALAKQRIEATARASGRDPGAIDIGGYLLCLVDDSRAAALDRAKREPFAIYMLAVQSDISMRRVGLDPSIRTAVMAAWRSGDYHAAAGLIPDEFVDAFLLCGTIAEIAARAEAYVDAGMTLPILQPVVQTEEQISRVIDAAALFGSGASAMVSDTGRHGGTTRNERLSLRRRAGGWSEIARPFSLTASFVPVAAAGALAAVRGEFSVWPFLAALVAGMLLQIGTNVVNEIYDVRKGIDTITSPRASHALVTGRVKERSAFLLAGTSFAIAIAIGLVLIAVRGWPLLLLGAAGLVGGWGYTAPPLQYKYRALGLPLVFLLMGPLMVVGGYYAVAGHWSWEAAVLSIPIGLLVTAILHGNEWRDVGEDARAGISTLSIRAGRVVAHQVYVFLLVGAYIALAASVALTVLPPLSLLAVLSLPLFVRALRASELGAAGQQRAIAMIDLQTAQLHAAFGLLLATGLAAAAIWQR